MSDMKSAETLRQAIGRADSAARAGRWREALGAYAVAVETAGTGSRAGVADACRGAAVIHMRLGEWEAAVKDANESRRVAAEIRDERRLALAENLLGAIAFERGDWYEAGRRFGVAREHAGTIGDEPLLVEIENNDGVLWAAMGEHERAKESFRWAMARFEELERHPCCARVLNNLGMVLVAEGRFDEADALYERALAEAKRRLDLALGASVMVNRARLALLQNDLIRAHTLAETASLMNERIDGSTLSADVACVAGAVARTLRNWSEAEKSLRQALAQCDRGRSPLTEAEVWMELGELYAAQDRTAEARAAWERARDRYRALGAAAEAERAQARTTAGAAGPIGEPT